MLVCHRVARAFAIVIVLQAIVLVGTQSASGR
jgi:hypothetical protein